MKEITVYADFDFPAAPQIIGTLGYEHVRGNDHVYITSHGRKGLPGSCQALSWPDHPRASEGQSLEIGYELPCHRCGLHPGGGGHPHPPGQRIFRLALK